MIYFVKNSNYGSALELCDNLSASMDTFHRSCSVWQSYFDNHKVSSNTIILVKHLNLQLAKKLKDQGNKVIYFIVDDYPKEFVDFDFDAIIYSSKKQQQDFSKFFNKCPSYIYYHHYSPAITISEEEKHTKDIGYFVGINNVNPFLKVSKLVESYVENFHEYKNNTIHKYKFHIENSYHTPTNLKHKPCIKLSTAAKADSVFICSKNNSYVELLPQNWPYYIPENITTQTDFDFFMQKCIGSYGSYDYISSLYYMRKLRQELNIQETSKKLINFIMQNKL